MRAYVGFIIALFMLVGPIAAAGAIAKLSDTAKKADKRATIVGTSFLLFISIVGFLLFLIVSGQIS